MRIASTPTVLLAAAVILLVACGGGEPAAREPEPENGGAVTYEPAYPEEVSAEGLSDEDAAQQENAHDHDGGAGHEHGEGAHSHDGEAGDDHGHDH